MRSPAFRVSMLVLLMTPRMIAMISEKTTIATSNSRRVKPDRVWNLKTDDEVKAFEPGGWLTQPPMLFPIVCNIQRPQICASRILWTTAMDNLNAEAGQAVR